MVDEFRPFEKEEFKEIYSKVVRPCIDVIVPRDNGIILTLRTIVPHKGKYHLPGGTVAFGKNSEEMVKYIAKKETGLDVELIEPLGSMIEFFNPGVKGSEHIRSQVYTTKVLGGELKTDENAAKIMIVKNMEEIPKKILPEHGEFLEEFWPKISSIYNFK